MAETKLIEFVLKRVFHCFQDDRIPLVFLQSAPASHVLRQIVIVSLVALERSHGPVAGRAAARSQPERIPHTFVRRLNAARDPGIIAGFTQMYTKPPIEFIGGLLPRLAYFMMFLDFRSDMRVWHEMGLRVPSQGRYRVTVNKSISSFFFFCAIIALIV